MLKFIPIMPLLITLFFSSCQLARPQASSSTGLSEAAASSPRLCAAIRGNGQYIFAHFGSLARMTEVYGPMRAIVGGSSASITAFLYESAMMNPALRLCSDNECSDEVLGTRLAFTFKMLPTVMAVLGNTDEVKALQYLTQEAQKIQEIGIDKILEQDSTKATMLLKKVDEVLKAPTINSLVNPALFNVQNYGGRPDLQAREIHRSASSLLDFKVDDNSLLFRPGLISFAGLADAMGRVADFLAGYEPADNAAYSELLNSCAALTKNLSAEKTWNFTAEGATASCGVRWQTLYTNYRQKVLTMRPIPTAKRLGEKVGAHMPVLVATGVLSGEASRKLYQKGVASYRRGDAPVNFPVEFSTIEFAYIGQDSVKAVERLKQTFTDIRAQRSVALGPLTWKTALTLSPVEPGLGNMQELNLSQNKRYISLGGWSDLAPVQALKSLAPAECDKVIYVTRQSSEARFASELMKTALNMRRSDCEAFSDLGTPTSSFSTALQQTSGTWCSDWDNLQNQSFGAAQIHELFAKGYSAGMITSDAGLERAGVSSNAKVLGCHPEATEDNLCQKLFP